MKNRIILILLVVVGIAALGHSQPLILQKGKKVKQLYPGTPIRIWEDVAADCSDCKKKSYCKDCNFNYYAGVVSRVTFDSIFIRADYVQYSTYVNDEFEVQANSYEKSAHKPLIGINKKEIYVIRTKFPKTKSVANLLSFTGLTGMIAGATIMVQGLRTESPPAKSVDQLTAMFLNGQPIDNSDPRSTGERTRTVLMGAGMTIGGNILLRRANGRRFKIKSSRNSNIKKVWRIH